MTRRELIGAGLGLAAGGLPLIGRGGSSATEAKPRGRVRFGLFADIHYSPHYWPNDNVEFLEKILERAARAKSDFVLHLGDFCHDCIKDHEYVDFYNDFRLPTYHTFGNHDDDAHPHARALEAYRMKDSKYFFDCNGWRFIVLDLNYFVNPKTGKSEHYATMNYLNMEGVTQHVIFPDEEIEWMKGVIDSSPYPCVVASHQSLEKDTFHIGNHLKARKVFEDANRKCPGKVRLVMNGHDHTDNWRLINNILYWDVNSANYWYPSNPHNCYPEEYVKTHVCAPHSIAWTEPLSAIVTLDVNGRITIEGAHADYLYGVSAEKAFGIKYDVFFRTVRPEIQDIDLTLHYS